MKSLVFAAVLLMSALSTNAFAWSSLATCDSGALVVDQGANDQFGRPSFQMVLRGQPLAAFVSQDAVATQDVNSKGEFIMNINTEGSTLKGFSYYGQASNGMQIYRNYIIIRQGSDITLRATIGNRYLGETEKANWVFHGCY